MKNNSDRPRFRVGGWLSVLLGAALGGGTLHALGDQYHPAVAVWWMLGGVLLGTLCGVGAYALAHACLGVARADRPPAEYEGMSMEQRRLLRQNERRRAKRGIVAD